MGSFQNAVSLRGKEGLTRQTLDETVRWNLQHPPIFWILEFQPEHFQWPFSQLFWKWRQVRGLFWVLPSRTKHLEKLSVLAISCSFLYSLLRPLPSDFWPLLCIQTALAEIDSDLHIVKPSGTLNCFVTCLCSAYDTANQHLLLPVNVVLRACSMSSIVLSSLYVINS